MERGELVGYQKLISWQLADEFAWEVYKLTYTFPKEELYGLTSQLRRAVLSVPLNIVEGHARNSKREFKRFLKIALGSLAEVDYILQFAFRCNYLEEADHLHLSKLRASCGKVLWKPMLSQ